MAVVQALYDAADDDAATGGPDITRRIFPVVYIVDDNGYRRIEDAEVGRVIEVVLAGRMIRPDGPHAPLA